MMKAVYNKYLNDELKLNKIQMISIISLIIIISGTFGWIYEFIFYYFNFGCQKFYFQGGNFLPWINIYAIGSIIIVRFTKKFKKNPVLIFLIAFLSTGILEYLSGFVIDKYFNLRLWNYNAEILNFGNINGYVCLRSVLFFGLSGLLLIYFILPFIIYLVTKIDKKIFYIISIVLCSIVLFDEVYNLLFARILNTPRARDVYTSIGINYMDYEW